MIFRRLFFWNYKNKICGVVFLGMDSYIKRKSVRGRRFSKGVNLSYIPSRVNISSRESKKVRLIAYSNSICIS